MPVPIAGGEAVVEVEVPGIDDGEYQFVALDAPVHAAGADQFLQILAERYFRLQLVHFHDQRAGGRLGQAGETARQQRSRQQRS
ncbi:hypothetical protein D9M71_759300 [compost metagenome]